MGNVEEGITNPEVAKRFAPCNVLQKEECKKCFAKYYCSGGCAANCYQMNGDLTKNYELGCELARKRTEIAISLALLEQEE